MKKFFKEYRFPLLSFLIWRAALFIIQTVAFKFIPLGENFLGGGKSTYLTNPYLWSWANFDGEHYLSIAQNGYKPLQYFYFPGYPVLVGLLSKFTFGGLANIQIIALLVCNFSFLLALIGLWKLVKIDYSENIAKLVINLLLIFPTSFYFAATYTESLFFCLIIWSFYFARREKWFWSGLLGGVGSVTRVIGAFLFPAFLVEIVCKSKKIKFSAIYLFLLLIPLGILIYMYYLKQVTGDPLNFLHTVSIFGAQRSTNFTLPPRVIYRYIFKVLPNIDYKNYSIVFTTYLEFIVGAVFMILSILSFFKLRASYISFLVFGYLTPVFSGSFSSMPRYVVVLFPAFILLAIYFSKLPKILQICFFALLFMGLGVSLSLFSRGYWIS